MDYRGREAFVSPNDETVPLEPERAVRAPRFDEKSIQRARPAVPLRTGEPRRRAALPVSMIVVCVVALLAGAGLGVVVLTLMRGDDTGAGARDTAQRRAAESEPAVRDEAAIGAAALPAEGAREQAASDDDALAAGTAEEAAAPGDARAELRGALESWLAATNARDLDSQMGFYDSTLEAFYLSRGASRAAVRAEKARAFSGASSVEVSAAEPEITLARDGATAVMRFRKKYSVEGSGGARRGEVLQELRWRRTPRGWKIISERDLRVIR